MFVFWKIWFCPITDELTAKNSVIDVLQRAKCTSQECENVIFFYSSVLIARNEKYDRPFMNTFSSLTLLVPCISESCIEINIKLHFYFHTSLWCLKRFYEGLESLYKTFCGATKEYENKNLT